MSDLIDRQAAIDAIKKYSTMVWEKYQEPFPESTIMELIQALPPVEPKQGKWKPFDVPWYQCSECGAVRENKSFMELYCPNCEAKMVEPQERGDKG